jgi:hypothetical protein
MSRSEKAGKAVPCCVSLLDGDAEVLARIDKDFRLRILCGIFGIAK